MPASTVLWAVTVLNAFLGVAGAEPCNRSPVESTTDLAPKPALINGVPANAGEFGFMVSLQRPGLSGKLEHFCGGALITQKHVITAAHCLEVVSSFDDFYVVIGVNNLKDASKSNTFKVAKAAGFETYNASDPVVANDIALLFLERSIPIELRTAGRFIIVPNDKDPDLNQQLTIAGWGRTKYLGSVSPRLLKATLAVMSTEECEKKLPAGRTLLPTQVCFSSATQSACQGDSGGPIFRKDKNTGSYALIGITSTVMTGCLVGQPNIFTRVKKFRGWIDEKIKEDNRAILAGPAKNCTELKQQRCSLDIGCIRGKLTVRCDNAKVGDVSSFVKEVKRFSKDSFIAVELKNPPKLTAGALSTIADKILVLTIADVSGVFDMSNLKDLGLKNLRELRFQNASGVVIISDGLAVLPQLRSLVFVQSVIAAIEEDAFTKAPTLENLVFENGFDPRMDADEPLPKEQRDHLLKFHCDGEYKWFRDYLAAHPQLFKPKQPKVLYNADSHASRGWMEGDFFVPVNCNADASDKCGVTDLIDYESKVFAVGAQ